jgi:DNA-binding CsgD family transcriptional regulator
MPGFLIPSATVRRLLRLQWEIAEISGAVAQSRHLIDDLCQIVGADGGGMGLSTDFRPGGSGRLLRHYTSGFAAANDSELVVDRLEPTTALDPAIQSLMHHAHRGTVTLGRRELASDREWYQSGYVNDICRLAGIDDVIYSIVPGPTKGSVFGVALYRQWGGRPFGSAERDLVHLFQEESLKVHQLIYRDALPPKVRLSPRLAETLQGLLDGLAEKEIAARMEISIHTVHGFVKEIYLRFGVRSRPQLLSLFMRSR